MLWISWQARTQSPQRTHLFWSRTSSWSKQMRSLRRYVRANHENSKRGQLFAIACPNHGAWLDHESLLLILSWLRGLRPMCTRMSMDIRVHLTQSTFMISSKTLSTSSLTINAPLIVKDEVDKIFEPILSQQNKKSYVGLRLIVIWDPPVPGPLKTQDRRVHDYYSNRIVII